MLIRAEGILHRGWIRVRVRVRVRVKLFNNTDMVKYNEKSKRNLPGVIKTRLANIL